MGKKKLRQLIQEHPYGILALGTVLSVVVSNLLMALGLPEMALILGIFFLMGCILTYLGYRFFKKTLDLRSFLIATAVLSFLLRLAYILSTPYSSRQYDVDFIGTPTGHLGYMEYLLAHGFRLPDFDPTTVWQYYHPPLHYYLGAIFLGLQSILHLPKTLAVENLQFMGLFWSGVLLIVSYRIFRALNLRGRGLIAAFALMAFHPAWTFMSGTLNNDMAVQALSALALYFTIVWYKDRSLRSILYIGIFLALAMLTKASAALLIPAIGVSFVVGFIQDHEKLRLLKQFGWFLLVSVPLGLSFAVYNLLRWGMPLNFVQPMPDNHVEFIGDYPLVERFTDLNWIQLKVPWRMFMQPSVDHNIFIGMLKTSLFGEGNFFGPASVFNHLASFLFYLNIFLVVLALGAMVLLVLRKHRDLTGGMKVFLMTLYLTLMGSFVNFNIASPYMCTYNYRYIPLTMMIGAFFLGFLLNRLEDKTLSYGRRRTGWLGLVVYGLVLLFVFSSAGLYMVLCVRG